MMSWLPYVPWIFFGSVGLIGGVAAVRALTAKERRARTYHRVGKKSVLTPEHEWVKRIESADDQHCIRWNRRYAGIFEKPIGDDLQRVGYSRVEENGRGFYGPGGGELCFDSRGFRFHIGLRNGHLRTVPYIVDEDDYPLVEGKTLSAAVDEVGACNIEFIAVEDWDERGDWDSHVSEVEVRLIFLTSNTLVIKA